MKSEGTTIFKTYSTAHLARGSTLTYWNDVHNSVFTPLEVKPFDREQFEAELSFDTIGPVGIVKTFSTAAIIEHSEKHVQQTVDRRAFLVMPIHGRVTASCYGREALLDIGDFAFTDSFATSRLVLESINHAICLVIPYQLLTTQIPDAEALFGVRVRGDRGVGNMVSVLLRCLAQRAEPALPAQFEPDVAKNLLALVATAYAIEQRTDTTASSLLIARRAQIKRFIEAHLRDADLNAVIVAEALGLSARYVRMVCASEGESVSAYILRRRLEECARQLRHTLWLGRSITDTALDWGFNSMAHFTRAFKQHFGVTPTAYRRSAAAALESSVPKAR